MKKMMVMLGLAIMLSLLGYVKQRARAAESVPRIVYGEGREIAKLACKAITESSGLAAGRANKNVFWTHNDSGGKPQLFAFGLKGEELAVITLSGAAARDWEDMASFSHGGKHFLLVGDVGDNAANREDCTLYVVAEPTVDPHKRGQERSVAVLQTIRFRYEDGAHNCESVAVDPETRTIYMVSKVNGPDCKVYALPWPVRPGKAPVVAKAIASLRIFAVTAMDISPDGLRAVVLTYGDAFEFVRVPGETWAQGFSQPPRRIPMPPRVQGESICYGPDGKTLYLTSECKGKDSANPSPLLEVPVVKDIPDVPAARGEPGVARDSRPPAPQPMEPKPLSPQEQAKRDCEQWLLMADNYKGRHAGPGQELPAEGYRQVWEHGVGGAGAEAATGNRSSQSVMGRLLLPVHADMRRHIAELGYARNT